MNMHNPPRDGKPANVNLSETVKAPALSPLHQAARDYAAKDWPVFPCIAGDKKPACANGYQDGTTDLDVIDMWWTENPEYNIGLCPDDVGLAVIDEDSAKGGDVAPLHLPKTRTVETPSGGKHYYFLGSVPPTVGKLGPHIDTRGQKSYVLVPPSVVNGKSYREIDDRDPVALPAEIEDRAAARADAQTSEVHDLDLPGNVATARRKIADLIERKDVAVQDQGGDNRTYQLACELVRDLGLSVDKALEVIAPWNDACVPPWSDDELRAKLENAASYGQNEAGTYATTPAADKFKLPEGEVAGTGAKQSLAPIKFSDLLAQPVRPVDEIIPGLIEKGIATMLSGPGGTHKSRLALQFGLCVQAGVPVFGNRVTRATFIYLDYENGRNEIARRTQAINGRLKLPALASGGYLDLKTRVIADNGPVPAYEASPTLATVTDEGITLEPMYHELYGYLRSITGHKFVVLDSCYNVLRFIGQAKINETAVKAALDLLDHLCAATDSTIVYLWHPSQAGMTRGDATGWSVAWHNTPRARLSINRVENVKDAFDLKVEKRNNGPYGQVTTLHWLDGVLLPAADVGGEDREKLLFEACIRVALQAAEMDTPITRQRKLIDHQLVAIEREVGFKPTQREVKEQLHRAVLEKRLRYSRGYGKQMAGYFPFSLDPSTMRTLAAMGGLPVYQAGMARDKAHARRKAEEAKGEEAETVPDEADSDAE